MADWIPRLHKELLAVEALDHLDHEVDIDFGDAPEGAILEIDDDEERLVAFEPWQAWLRADWDPDWARNLAILMSDMRQRRNRASPDDVTIAKMVWTDNCTTILQDAICKWGPHFSSFVSDLVRSQITPETWTRAEIAVDTAKKQGRVVHTLPNLLNYHAEDMVGERGWDISFGEELHCMICGLLTSTWVVSPSLLRYFDGVADFAERPVGPDCFWRAFGLGERMHRQPEVRPDVLSTRLRSLAEALGGIPPPNYLGRPSLWETVPVDRSLAVLKALHDMPSPDSYKEAFGPWLKALSAAGLINDDARPTSRGVQCLAKDGHVCFSLAEKMIDDWLFDNGIAHEKEPLYPSHPVMNPKAALRADWRVGSVWIEYFGLCGSTEYDERVTTKKMLTRNIGIDLLDLYQKDLRNLSIKLGRVQQHPSP